MPATAPRMTPSPRLVPESQHWLFRAQQCRAIASRMQQDFAREHMLKAAENFERSARETKEREIARGITRIGELMRDLHRG